LHLYSSRLQQHGKLQEKIMRYKTYLPIVVAVILGLASILAYFVLRTEEETGILEASGQVRGTEVTVSSKLAGRLDILTAREGQTVNKGDLIARIAAAEIEARLEQVKAEAAVAESRLAEATAGLQGLESTTEQAKLNVGITKDTATHDTHLAREALQRTEAEIKAAEAELTQAQSNYQRNKALLEKGFISQGYFDQVQARLDVSDARVVAARKGREEASAALQRAGVGKDEVRVRQIEVQRLGDERLRLKAVRDGAKGQALSAQAKVKEIQALLADVQLTSPITGTVINRLAEPGELVAPGRPIVTLNDLSDLYVRVFVAEQDIGLIRLGNPARIKVDAFPDKYFTGRISEIAQQAEFTPKEVHMKDERAKQVFGVKIRIDDTKGYLKPGMPADIEIKWQDGAEW
jgi:HlyD family secretion protein